MVAFMYIVADQEKMLKAPRNPYQIRVKPENYIIYGYCQSDMTKAMFAERFTAEAGKEYLFECSGRGRDAYHRMWSIP